ncbi:hypothetical protein [Streptomyces sp. NPDC052225]|uniref:hypothetical protein n=1 Tax=Streptomyces sp. NPDC052225 TaxID=3154949 RepID=UPI00343EE9EA
MGIESDQIVFDYLSRVGDLAQQRQLPSQARMRLVSELRNEIDRRRARVTVDSPAAVRRILERLGSPDRIVTEARENGGSSGGAAPVEFAPEVPEQRTGRAAALRKMVPRPRREPAPEPVRDLDRDAPSPPHLAGTDELGSSAPDMDWWAVADGGPGGLGETDTVPGFTGGVEIPDILKSPPKRDAPDLRKKPLPEVIEADDAADEEDEVIEAAASRRTLPRLGPAAGWTNPLLLLAAVALVAGAILGNVLALLLGWAVVYLSRRLTLGQKKWAVFGLPGLAAAGGIVWLWGRSEGRWGEPIADGRMSGALADTWPWVLRCAAVASALYLVWRSQRSR